MRAPLLLLFLALGCAGAQQPPSDARKTIVSLRQIDCSDCGDEIVAALRDKPGVYQAKFDRDHAEVEIVASPQVDAFTDVRKLAAERGWEAVLGGGQGGYIEGPVFPDGSDAALVSKGGVDVPAIEPYLVEGKVTVVDFSASWCGPCRKVDEHMVQVLAARKDVAYRRFDIKDWDTPLAKHFLRDVPQLPYVIVFDKKRVKKKSIAGLDNAGLDAAIDDAAK